uniref:Probable DNA helicase MCM8 n=1 Tax=Glycine max TaxID=3847 RepID=A0A0R0KSJ9_SOYBN
MDPFGLIDILGTYFPQQLFTIDDTWLNLTSALLSFFSSPPGQNLVSQVKKLDFLQLQQICHVEELYKMLTEKPKIALLYDTYLVLTQVFLSKWVNGDLEHGAKVDIRLHNCPETMIALKNLKAAYIVFECSKCKQPVTRIFPDGKYSPPSICNLNGCKSKFFISLRSTAQTIDFQKIRVQELLKPEDHEEGRVPRTVECELTQDLVRHCIPGDVVTVTGIIRGINTYMDIGGGKANPSLLVKDT